MNVQRLVLRNYRNYSFLDLSFSKGLNIIVGDNAEGKTNIVEAIHFLSLARSFRTSDCADLIKNKCQFASIEARVAEDNTAKQITAVLTLSGKKIACDGKQVRRISELSNLVNVLVFEPKDALMFNDSPKVRRDFLDINISKVSPIYLEALIKYERLLKERNALLKVDALNNEQLSVVTAQIIDVSEIIDRLRVDYVKSINKILGQVAAKIKGEEETLIIDYSPFVELNDAYAENAKKVYERNLDSDIKRKMTQVGIHREDYKMMLNGQDIAGYGSQGENRLGVIALKLCPYFLAQGKKPIVVLDDVLSELDKEHRQKIIAFLRNFEQVFITATNITINNASIYEVNKHTVTRRNA